MSEHRDAQSSSEQSTSGQSNGGQSNSGHSAGGQSNRQRAAARKPAGVPKARLWIAGLLATFGVAVTAATWRSEDGIWYNLIPLGVYVLLAGWVFETAEGLSRGSLSLRAGRVYRTESPIGFWLMVGLYVVLIGVIAIAFAGYEYDQSIGGD